MFGALADPMRARCCRRSPGARRTATELAGELPISRQAVSKHLNALSDAGLLERERSGRDVRYRVTPGPLSEGVSWMAGVGGQWDVAVGAAAAGADRTREAPLSAGR